MYITLSENLRIVWQFVGIGVMSFI